MSSHPHHRIHENSRESYLTGLGMISRRAQMVLEWIRENGKATDRQIMIGLGFREPNQVRPRITELIDAKLLREVGSVRCPVTGKTVRVVDLMQTQEDLFR